MKKLLLALSLITSFSFSTFAFDQEQCEQEIAALKVVADDILKSSENGKISHDNYATLALAVAGMGEYIKSCDDITTLTQPIKKTLADLKK